MPEHGKNATSNELYAASKYTRHPLSADIPELILNYSSTATTQASADTATLNCYIYTVDSLQERVARGEGGLDAERRLQEMARKLAELQKIIEGGTGRQ
jgi:hypothetical protein